MDDLMVKLATAKKIMDKVETGNFKKGQINEKILLNDPEEVLKEQRAAPSFQKDLQMDNMGVTENIDIEKIHQSKLPDAIKKAMINHPISQISLGGSLDKKIIDGAKRLMVEDNVQGSPNKKTDNGSPRKPENNSQLLNQLTPIIEKIIKKTITEVLEEKLNEILTAQRTMDINENLVIKVGDSIFRGKITGVNSK